MRRRLYFETFRRNDSTENCYVLCFSETDLAWVKSSR